MPFLLPPAYDKLLGHDPIRSLWQNLHRTNDGYTAIIIIGYSMPPYDAYAYKALGHLIVNYQARGPKTWFGQRRVPVQIVTHAASRHDVLSSIPFLRDDKTRIWRKGFNIGSLEWLDWSKMWLPVQPGRPRLGWPCDGDRSLFANGLHRCAILRRICGALDAAALKRPLQGAGTALF